ncbi:MAG TPA: hypothetical protein VLW75_00725, partial [Rhizomicrobium sp.]|nr:hypothetical protein [Rhizomicrobium sp.]
MVRKFKWIDSICRFSYRFSATFVMLAAIASAVAAVASAIATTRSAETARHSAEAAERSVEIARQVQTLVTEQTQVAVRDQLPIFQYDMVRASRGGSIPSAIKIVVTDEG